MKKIELLAPAGSWEALEAAVNAGADAVYLGGTAFGARAYAANFGREELRRAVRFAHLRRVRVFVTVNTLTDDSEVEELSSYLLFLRDLGADGLIVQDLGVVRLARRLVPELPLHASTQMTITSSAGVAFAKEAGLERSVLARELSLEEIKAACAMGEDIECFIHGALCICYSGQCLMSSLIGGRSGNRGRCAQPCRLPYVLQNEKGEPVGSLGQTGPYLLSPKDLNTLDVLPKLLDAGVMSLKIEGRMKRPEYVAVVVDIYRRAVDSYLAGHYFVSQTDKDNIQQIFNRDFTTAYLEKRPGKAMMSTARPNNRGVLLGRVLDIEKGRARIKLEKALHLGDGLEFWVKVGGRQGSTVTTICVNGKEREKAEAGETVTIAVPKGVGRGDRVFRTLDKALADYAQKFFGAGAESKLPLKALVSVKAGEPLHLCYIDEEGNKGEAVTAAAAQPALKRPLTKEIVYRHLERLGTTDYRLQEAEVCVDEGVMLPLSQLNEVRRQALAALETARLAAFPPLKNENEKFATATFTAAEKIKGSDEKNASSQKNSGAQKDDALLKSATKKSESIIAVHCDTFKKGEAALKAGAERLIFGGDLYHHEPLTFAEREKIVALCRERGREIAFATPRIVKEKELAFYARAFCEWAELEPDYVYIENNGLWHLAKNLPGLPLWCGRSLNIFNSNALAFYAEAGARGACLSCELNMEQLEALALKSELPLEVIVQGRLEMMVSEYCLPGSFLGGAGPGPCSWQCKERLFLGDRKGEAFPLVGDQACRMHILNAHDLSMAAHVPKLQKAGLAVLTIDARYYDVKETAALTKLYRQALAGAVPEENIPGTTRGHFFRGVL